MGNRLRIGVVGVGHLGQHHARILGSMPDVELVAVADSRLEQAETVAQRCGCRAVADYRELFGKVDAVSIAVPTILHREVAGAFLSQGIPAMVEKPLAGSLAEAESLVSLARGGGTVLQVGHIERFNPALSALSQLAIRPKYITAERLSTYTFRSTDIGAVLDLMIHDIDLVLSLIPAPVRSVSAVGVCLFGEHEDVANARIEFDDGAVANLTASRASYASMRKMRIWGSEGYASLDFAAKQATLVQPSDEFLRGELDLDEVDLSQPSAVKEHLFGKVLRVDQVQATGREPLALELEDFVRAARGHAVPRVSGDDALRAMRLADQVLRSLAAHHWDSDATPSPTPAQPTATESVLRGPHAWRTRKPRPTPRSTGH
jgi:predicted dehydrogenase